MDASKSSVAFILCPLVAPLLVPAGTGAEIFILFTVDTETMASGDPDRNIWGKLPGHDAEHGIGRMMDLLDGRGAKGTFFVDVYEMPIHGEDAMAEVCREILARGQDLELHTHPGAMFGAAYVQSMDLPKQVEVLRRGAALIKEWTGAGTLAHQSGGYMANLDTVTACRQVGIAMEMSYNMAWPASRIGTSGLTQNAAFVREGVLCVPVTCYAQVGLDQWRSVRCLDIESSLPTEIQEVVVIGNWKDPADYRFPPDLVRRTREELGLRESVIAICFIANLGRERHLEPLLSAVEGDSRFACIVGGDGPQADLACEYANRSRNMVYLGHVPPARVPLLTAACDVVYYGFDRTNPNARWSAPNKLHEAIVAGKPILTGDFGEIGDVVRASGCGAMADTSTTEGVKPALDQLGAPDSLRAVANRVRSVCASGLSRDEAGRRIATCYAELTPNARPGSASESAAHRSGLAPAGAPRRDTAGSGPIYVIFTVDTEASSEGFGTVGGDIWGKLPGHTEQYGIGRIMDIFDRQGLKVTFFVDVYEAGTFGEQALAEVCRHIASRGHDVELHTHPHHMYDLACTSDGDLKMQIEVLHKGAEMIRQWTGQPVVAHRAGGYQGNYDTVTACRSVGIELEFSHNWGFHGEGFRHPPLTVNRAVVHEGVLCVPVTNYVQGRLGNWASVRILDIESSSAGEIRKVIADLRRQGVRTAVIMMHSLSLMRRGTRRGIPNPRVEQTMENLLRDSLTDPNVRIVSARELHEIFRKSPETLAGQDHLPTTGWWMTYCRAWQRLGEGWKNIAAALIPIAMVVCLIVAAALWMVR